MSNTNDRIDHLADRLHAMDRHAINQPKADALLRVAEALLREDATFCEDFADSIERKLGTAPPPLRLAIG